MPFNWEGRWSHRGQDQSEQGLWKTKRLWQPRPCISVALTRRQGLALEPARHRGEIAIAAPVRHTDRPIHKHVMYWVSGGMLFIHFIIAVVFVFCRFFDSFWNLSH